MGSRQSKGFSTSVSIEEIQSSPDIVWETIADISGMKSYSPCIQSISPTKNVRDDFDYEKHEFRSSSSFYNDKNVSDKSCSDNNMGKVVMTEGMAWEEVRKFGSFEIKLLKQVTSIETTRVDVPDVSGKYIEQHELRSIRVHVKFLGCGKKFLNRNHYLDDAAKTVSYTVDSIVSTSPLIKTKDNVSRNDGESFCENDNATVSTGKSSSSSSLSSNATTAPCRLIASMAFIPSSSFCHWLLLFHQINFAQKYVPKFRKELTAIAKVSEKLYKDRIELDSLPVQGQ